MPRREPSPRRPAAAPALWRGSGPRPCRSSSGRFPQPAARSGAVARIEALGNCRLAASRTYQRGLDMASSGVECAPELERLLVEGSAGEHRSAWVRAASRFPARACTRASVRRNVGLSLTGSLVEEGQGLPGASGIGEEPALARTSGGFGPALPMARVTASSPAAVPRDWAVLRMSSAQEATSVGLGGRLASSASRSAPRYRPSSKRTAARMRCASARRGAASMALSRAASERRPVRSAPSGPPVRAIRPDPPDASRSSFGTRGMPSSQSPSRRSSAASRCRIAGMSGSSRSACRRFTRASASSFLAQEPLRRVSRCAVLEARPVSPSEPGRRRPPSSR
jgi:hypothetical protein